MPVPSLASFQVMRMACNWRRARRVVYADDVKVVGGEVLGGVAFAVGVLFHQADEQEVAVRLDAREATSEETAVGLHLCGVRQQLILGDGGEYAVVRLEVDYCGLDGAAVGTHFHDEAVDAVVFLLFPFNIVPNYCCNVNGIFQ